MGETMTPPQKPNHDTRDAYTEGLEAAHTGRSAADCPYEYNSPDGASWMKGFQDGDGHD